MPSNLQSTSTMPSNLQPTSTMPSNLPPSRNSRPLKPVSPPLSNTRLSRLIYLLVFLTALLTAYYSYRIVQFKSEVGGWWNVALGRRPPQFQEYQDGFSQHGHQKKGRKRDYDEESVESRINALAHALGMPSQDLASAIAVAVREYVPPASLSSVAAQETGPAVQAMLKGGTTTDNTEHHAQATSTGTGVVGGVVGGIESFVGLGDEPV